MLLRPQDPTANHRKGKMPRDRTSIESDLNNLISVPLKVPFKYCKSQLTDRGRAPFTHLLKHFHLHFSFKYRKKPLHSVQARKLELKAHEGGGLPIRVWTRTSVQESEP